MSGTLSGPQAPPQAPLGGMGQPQANGQDPTGGLYAAAMPAPGHTGLGMIPQTPGLYGSQGGLYSTLNQLAQIGLISLSQQREQQRQSMLPPPTITGNEAGGDQGDGTGNGGGGGATGGGLG